MKMPTLNADSEAKVAVALKMVSESRPRMNLYSDETREVLEQEAKAMINGDTSYVSCSK